jgi:hypothetical protein
MALLVIANRKNLYSELLIKQKNEVLRKGAKKILDFPISYANSVIPSL